MSKAMKSRIKQDVEFAIGFGKIISDLGENSFYGRLGTEA